MKTLNDNNLFNSNEQETNIADELEANETAELDAYLDQQLLLQQELTKMNTGGQHE